MSVLRDPRIARLRRIARVSRLAFIARQRLDETRRVVVAMEELGYDVSRRWVELLRLEQTYQALGKERDKLLETVDEHSATSWRVH